MHVDYIVMMAMACVAALGYTGAGLWSWRAHPGLRWLAAGAIALHTLTLLLQIIGEGGLRIGIFEALSLFAWQAALLLWSCSWRESIEVQGVVIYPIAGLFTVLGAWAPNAAPPVEISDPRIAAHVLLSLLSAGLLTLAAVHAVTLAIQDRLLHRHAITPINSRFPPLQAMERFLFQLIAVGFVMLSLTLLSGLWFVQDWMAQHLAHKTILSVSAWLIFGVLLFGRWRYGWRGRTAIRWTLWGYLFLILAYFGSKFVLELLLGTHWRVEG